MYFTDNNNKIQVNTCKHKFLYLCARVGGIHMVAIALLTFAYRCHNTMPLCNIISVPSCFFSDSLNAQYSGAMFLLSCRHHTPAPVTELNLIMIFNIIVSGNLLALPPPPPPSAKCFIYNFIRICYITIICANYDFAHFQTLNTP